MKKAANIMYLVSMILNIIGAAVIVLYGIGLLIMSAIPEILESILEQIPEEYEKYADLITGLYVGGLVTAAIFCFIFAALCVVAAVICHKARTNGSRKLYILGIVFGALTCTHVQIAASILSIIVENKENKRQEIETNAQVKDESAN